MDMAYARFDGRQMSAIDLEKGQHESVIVQEGQRTRHQLLAQVNQRIR